ncbi:helix-turn-helix domain-containing protein [Photobacterium damselae]|nr:LysR family transcriptional regulator [Photobacterium damselae]
MGIELVDRLSSIEIFVRAVELGSFTAVAEERGISAQMVGGDSN